MPAAPTREQRSAHTPGPWRVSAIIGDPIIMAGDEKIATVHSVRLPAGEKDWRRAERMDKRNARLIAAAPDGLALAYAVAEHFADTDAPLGKMAREFIRKATSQP